MITLGRAAEIALQLDDRPAPVRPLIEAQYMELRQRFERYGVDHHLKPGMFVREKQGLAVFRTEIPMAWIILRRFDVGDHQDAAIAVRLFDSTFRKSVCWRLDWVCAALTDDGVGMTHFVFDALQIEPVPLDELPEEAR